MWLTSSVVGSREPRLREPAVGGADPPGLGLHMHELSTSGPRPDLRDRHRPLSDCLSNGGHGVLKTQGRGSRGLRAELAGGYTGDRPFPLHVQHPY